MIDQDEIKAKAIEFDIHHPNVERDYVFGWLLKSLFENDYLWSRLVFKGGNCLRKAFYPDTRFSADLDFSVSDAIDVEQMGEQINNACREAQTACGVEFQIDRNTFAAGPVVDSARRSYKGRVYFTDFFGNQDDLTISVRLDVTDFDRLHLPTTKRQLIHPYSDATACSAELNCMALEEIVANKLKCLIQRRHIRCPKSTRFGFDRAVEGFKDSIERLFDGVGNGGWGEQLYFGGEHRHMILEAGAERRLMKLTSYA